MKLKMNDSNIRKVSFLSISFVLLYTYDFCLFFFSLFKFKESRKQQEKNEKIRHGKATKCGKSERQDEKIFIKYVRSLLHIRKRTVSLRIHVRTYMCAYFLHLQVNCTYKYKQQQVCPQLQVRNYRYSRKSGITL